MSKQIKKSIAIPIIVVVAGVAGGALWLTSHNSSQDNDKPLSTSKMSFSENQKNNTSSDKNNGSTEPGTSQTSPDHTPTKTTPPENNNGGSSSNSITGIVNHKQVSNGKLEIRVTINQLLTSGDCQLTLTSQVSGAKVTRSAHVVPLAQSSSCDGFSVPTSQLSSGKWNIVVSVTSGSKSGKITSDVSI